MAAQLKKDLGIDAQLVVGSSGEFTVWVDSTKVVEKRSSRFPEPAEVVTAIRAASTG